MSTYILHRRGPAAEWTAQNPTLFPAELGYETDTGKWKWGDGSTVWTALPYIEGGGGGGQDATTVIKGIIRLGGDLSGIADAPTVTSGANHSHTAAQVSDATVTGRALMTTASATTALATLGAAASTRLEGLITHDGTTGGGVRPTGFYRVRWIGGVARPTNMAAGDIWETT